MRLALSDLAIKSLKAPPKGQKTYHDQNLPGFGVRVSQGGTKTFTLMHGFDRRLTTIGRYPIISLAEARDKARKILARKTLGIENAVPTLTFGEAFDLFEQTHGKENRERTRKETARLIGKHLMPRLHARAIGDITTPEVAAIIDKLLPKPGTANHVYAVARLIFRWAARRRLIDRSPIDGLPPPSKPVFRDRVLAQDELLTVFHAAQDGSTFGNIIQVLILTGQRKSQIANLRREFIDEDAALITWPSELMKGNRRHSIPLSPMVAAILDTLPKEGYLFPARGRDTPFNGFSKAKDAFDRSLIGVAPYVIHDLRRTFASGMQELGIRIEVTEKLLNHTSGSFAGIVSVYQRHSYLPEMRASIQKWEDHLQALLSTLEETDGRDLRDVRRQRA